MLFDIIIELIRMGLFVNSYTGKQVPQTILINIPEITYNMEEHIQLSSEQDNPINFQLILYLDLFGHKQQIYDNTFLLQGWHSKKNANR